MSDSLKTNKTALIVGAVAVAVVLLCGCCGCGKEASDPQRDFLSQRFPYTGKWPTASGPLPVPFHNWNSDFFAIWCDADAAHVASVMAGSGLKPVLTTEGRAIAGLWNYHYHQSTGGEYHEAVIVLAATRDPNYPRISHSEPMEWIEALLFDGNYTNYVPKLWLSHQMPIDYGRDIFGTDKYLAAVKVDLPAGASGPALVDIKLNGGKENVWSANIPSVGLGATLAANMGMMSAFSLKNIWTALQVPTIALPITFPKGVIHKAFDQTVYPEVMNILWNDPPAVLQYWPADSTFAVGPEIAPYKVVPRLVQRASPGRFVMFPPTNVPPAKTK